ncbi:MAG: DUF2029 domain-containing protein [Chloroflexi bacterium]|nr:DUF2029 domain-containing protein [Chloroflexota bacterium]
MSAPSASADTVLQVAHREQAAPWYCAMMRGGLLARLLVVGASIGLFVQQSFYDHAADFKSFYSAGYAVRHPEVPLYDLIQLDENPFGEVFKLPPSAALLMAPFSFGTIQQARLIWRLVLVAAMLVAWLITARALGVRPLSWVSVTGLGFWSIFGPLQIAVGEGQWDPFFLLLLAIATLAVVRHRPLVAALTIALAASIKPYPLLVAGIFVARAWWRALAVTAAALAAFVGIGALAVGWDETIAFLTRVLPASGTTTAYPDNQTLGGVLARLIGDDFKPLPLSGAPGVDLAIRVVALVTTAATIWLARRRPAASPLDAALQVSLFVPLSILVIPAAWTHYQAICLLPLSVLAIDRLQRGRRDVAGWIMLTTVYVVLLLPNPALLYGAEIDRGLWLRSRADAANLALQHLYPTALSRLVLSYKALGVAALYGLLAWRVARLPRTVETASTPDGMAEAAATAGRLARATGRRPSVVGRDAP